MRKQLVLGLSMALLTGCLVPPGSRAKPDPKAQLRQYEEFTRQALQIAARPGGIRRVVVSDHSAYSGNEWVEAEPGDIVFEWPVKAIGCATLLEDPKVAIVELPGTTTLTSTRRGVRYGRKNDRLWSARIDGEIVFCGDNTAPINFDRKFGCYHDVDKDGDFDRIYYEADWMSGHRNVFNAISTGWSEIGVIGEPNYHANEDCTWGDAGFIRVQFIRFVPSLDEAETLELEFGIGFSERASTLGPVHRFSAFDAQGMGRTVLVPGLPDVEFRKAKPGRIHVRLSGIAEGEVMYWLRDRDDGNLSRSINLDFPPFTELVHQGDSVSGVR